MSPIERATVGLSAVLVISPFIPASTWRRGVRGLSAATLCSWVLYPVGFRWSVAVVAALVVVAVVVVSGADKPPRLVAKYEKTDPEAGVRGARGTALLVATFAAAGAVAVISALVMDAHAVTVLLDRVANSDKGLVYTLGVLAALFPAGALIGALTTRWSTAIETKLLSKDEALPRGLEGAGRYIGWLERTVIYFALVTNHVDAAAIVLTAKAIARFPSFEEESFAEYFLIGTLLSVVFGAAAAVGARLLVGLPAL